MKFTARVASKARSSGHSSVDREICNQQREFRIWIPTVSLNKLQTHLYTCITETLRHYATSRKVAGSSPDEVTGFFNLPNPSSRTMALGST
jgi:hypothetical protein